MSTELIIYLSLSAAWSAGCFGAGWFFGDLARRRTAVTQPLSEDPERNAPTVDLLTELTDSVEGPVEGSPDAPESTNRRRPWYKRSNSYLGGFVALVGLITVVAWWLQGAETKRLAEENQRQALCQQAYAVGFADAIDLRSKAQSQVNDAQDRMWRVFEKALNTPGPGLKAEFGAALHDYFSGRQAAKESPPYPDPPRDLCK